jgi:hypothetical protein
MSSRKRKPLYDLVDIRSLPEISSLDPDSLKEFTKEELLSYLVHFGTFYWLLFVSVEKSATLYFNF